MSRMHRLQSQVFQEDTPAEAEVIDFVSAAPRRGRVAKIASSTAPWAIIAGLLWSGLFIKPQPVGLTVTPPVIERRDFFYGLATPAPGVLWIAGSNGKVVRSDDAGKQWKLQSVPTKAHLQDIAAWDAKTAVAVGNKGFVAITADSGATWTEVEAPKSQIANKLTRVLARPDGHAWAVGEMGALLQSADFGKTWQRRRDEEDVGWNDVTFADANTGWVVGEFGRILRTIDGGNTWLQVQAPVQSSLMGVAFRDAKNGIAVGLEGVVLVTRDGGANWQSVKSGTREHLFTVLWDSATKQWIAGGNQGVWVSGREDGSNWTAGRLDARDLSWHTKATLSEGKVYFAGSNVGGWDGKTWQVVTASGRTPVAEGSVPELGRRAETPSTPAK